MKRTGCFFAGFAQNILSMEVVPPNSKTNLLSGLFGTLIIPPLFCNKELNNVTSLSRSNDWFPCHPLSQLAISLNSNLELKLLTS